MSYPGELLPHSGGLLGLSCPQKADQGFGWVGSWFGADCCTSVNVHSTYANSLTVAFLVSFQIVCKDQIQDTWPIINLKEAKTCVSSILWDFSVGLAAGLLLAISWQAVAL